MREKAGSFPAVGNTVFSPSPVAKRHPPPLGEEQATPPPPQGRVSAVRTYLPPRGSWHPPIPREADDGGGDPFHCRGDSRIARPSAFPLKGRCPVAPSIARLHTGRMRCHPERRRSRNRRISPPAQAPVFLRRLFSHLPTIGNRVFHYSFRLFQKYSLTLRKSCSIICKLTIEQPHS